MPTKHIEHIGTGLVGLAGLVLAILFSLHTATHPENTTITVKTQTPPTGSITPPRARFQSSTHPSEDVKLKHFQNSDFYRIIIDNNLFRPLGWPPPRPQEPYRLLGTIIPIDAKSRPKAIIQNIVRNQTHIVTISDTLDSNTYVTDIQTKHITLKKNGQQRQLTLKSSFLQRR
ncbi:hypothetical protein C6499_13740 [Candidatus Poribacteria bacterium]|nr:MAG: hypothetical protein C6499_13740 [Candidatus Poribacteria bacterium]